MGSSKALLTANVLLRTGLANLADLFKIRQTALLAFSGVMGYLISAASLVDPLKLASLIAALLLSISGTTGVNMYFDADIDSKMPRTARRVIPSNKLPAKAALAISLMFVFAGLAISMLINFWVFLAASLGFLIHAFVYTILTKRRTWTSVIYGGFAGGMPVFGGYMAHTGYPTAEALMLLLFIALWSNPHIWYIAIYTQGDYRRAGIPTLPTVKGVRVAIKASMLHIAAISFLVIAYFVASNFAIWLTLITTLTSSAMILRIMGKHMAGFSSGDIYAMIKYLSLYQVLIFLAIYADKLLSASNL